MEPKTRTRSGVNARTCRECKSKVAGTPFLQLTQVKGMTALCMKCLSKMLRIDPDDGLLFYFEYIEDQIDPMVRARRKIAEQDDQIRYLKQQLDEAQRDVTSLNRKR